jgi:hypothetical protein
MSRETPLHRACGDSSSSVDKIRRLIDEDPKALTKQDCRGCTPLHWALYFHRFSPEILHCILDRCPPEVLGLRYLEGSPPFHYACSHGVAVEIIRRMLLMYPKALKIINYCRESPLLCACQCDRSTLELIKLFTDEYPTLTILLDARLKRRTPHDWAVLRLGSAKVLSHLVEVAKEVAIALLICVSNSLITLPPAAIAHILQVVPDFSTEGFAMSYYYMSNSSDQAVHQVLDDPATVKTLVDNEDLQEMINDENNQDLICGVYRMLKASRRMTNDTQMQAKHHLFILESVAGTPDFFYRHLRDNPCLCFRTTTDGRAHLTASTVQEEPTSAVQVKAIH